jgi:hypothetical protein
MVRRAVGVLLMCVAVQGAVAAQQPAPPSAGQKRLEDLVKRAEGPYTKVGNYAWSTPYRGKNMSGITVRIVAAEEGVFFFVDLFDRKTVPLSRNLLLKVAELNSHFDYAKIALTDDSLQVRLDCRAKLLDLDEFKALESQIASVADEAYPLLKDFIQ